jgi:glycosyltransferase involved in cell wall biosynthesis
MKTPETVSTIVNTPQEDKQTAKPFVSIVVPAYNEADIVEKNLAILCEYMDSIEDEYRWELIVVNDGSTDETGDLAEAFAKSRDNVTVLHHMYNFRLGQALRYAFNNCKGDYVVVMDIDLSYSPEHIERLLTKIREARAKVVIASPYMKGGKVSNVPWLRKMSSVWANRFLAFFAKDRFLGKLATVTSMVRAYDRKFLSRLNLKAMDYDIMPEIIYKSMVLRARIVEIPAHLNWRVEEDVKSQGKKRKSSIRFLRSVISSLISGFIFRPFMFFILPGVILILISLYPIGWALIHAVVHYQSLPPSDLSALDRFSASVAMAFSQSPHSFIVGGITLMIAIQLLSLGFMALQSKRYFEELFHLGSTIYKVNRQDQTMR